VVSSYEVLIRLACATLFGALIGVERQWRHKNAGIKTNTLVALGAAGFALISNTFGPNNHNPAQLAAAVVTGIGFLGAGVIIHRGGNVQGVNTAATLWANASMGIAVGFGYIGAGAMLMVTTLLVQFLARYAESAVLRLGSRARAYELRVECDLASLPLLNAAWSTTVAAHAIEPLRRVTSRGDGRFVWRGEFVASSEKSFAGLEEQAASISGVTSIEVRRLEGDEEVA
jgi:putative Mg2+ transporter-C (MgtC) family protein